METPPSPKYYERHLMAVATEPRWRPSPHSLGFGAGNPDLVARSVWLWSC